MYEHQHPIVIFLGPCIQPDPFCTYTIVNTLFYFFKGPLNPKPKALNPKRYGRMVPTFSRYGASPGPRCFRGRGFGDFGGDRGKG